MIVRWPFPDVRCAYCRSYPCECRTLVSCRCVCGAILEAIDTLDAKAQAHAIHAGERQHLAWRAGR